MISSILKIVQYILGLVLTRAKSESIKSNAENKLIQKEKDKHNKLIEESFKTKDLDKIRKEAAE